jgi:hypothetical protein
MVSEEISTIKKKASPLNLDRRKDALRASQGVWLIPENYPPPRHTHHTQGYEE